jgi:integrase
LAAFAKFKLARRTTTKQVTEQRQAIERLVIGCGWRTIQQINEVEATNWLGEQRERKDEPHSPQTSKHYTDHLRCFTSWLATHNRLPRDPLVAMPRQPGTGEIPQTFYRRALNDAEFAMIITNARTSPAVYDSITPRQRVHIYYIARWTGFRAAEVASLAPGSFDLDADEPAITIECTISKRRKLDRQIVPPAVIQALRDFILEKPKGEPLFPGKWYRKAAEMLRVDSVDVNLKTDEGVIHFHSLLHTFITNLGESGASERQIMAVGRLSCSSLVARYCHLDDKHKAEIVGRLHVAPLQLT